MENRIQFRLKSEPFCKCWFCVLSNLKILPIYEGQEFRISESFEITHDTRSNTNAFSISSGLVIGIYLMGRGGQLSMAVF